MKSIIKLAAILLSSIVLNCNGLSIIQVAKIKIPAQTDQKTFCKIISIRNDGAFLSAVYIPSVYSPNVYEPKIGICVKNDGSHVIFPIGTRTDSRETNIIERLVENGSPALIQDEIINSIQIQNSGISILKSINKNGYLSEEFIFSSQRSERYKVSGQAKTFTGVLSNTNNVVSQITKFDKNGNATSVLKMPGYSSTANIFESTDIMNVKNREQIHSSDIDPNHKNIYSSTVEDGYAIYYKVIDDEIFNANRITFGSSQNGSLTATVNNLDQSILNIQSSTNLIDWNTFKTIQNEPSLEIVVPANKPKEFIRAIE